MDRRYSYNGVFILYIGIFTKIANLTFYTLNVHTIIILHEKWRWLNFSLRCSFASITSSEILKMISYSWTFICSHVSSFMWITCIMQDKIFSIGFGKLSYCRVLASIKMWLSCAPPFHPVHVKIKHMLKLQTAKIFSCSFLPK